MLHSESVVLCLFRCDSCENASLCWCCVVLLLYGEVVHYENVALCYLGVVL